MRMAFDDTYMWDWGWARAYGANGRFGCSKMIGESSYAYNIPASETLARLIFSSRRVER